MCYNILQHVMNYDIHIMYYTYSTLLVYYDI